MNETEQPWAERLDAAGVTDPDERYQAWVDSPEQVAKRAELNNQGAWVSDEHGNVYADYPNNRSGRRRFSRDRRKGKIGLVS